MLLLLIQFLMIGSLILLAAIPVAFLVLIANYLKMRTHGRASLITGSFMTGALASGLVVWHLIPSEWTLPFWTTLEAAGNAQKYGHPVEHYAECIVVLLLFTAVLGGAIGAGAAAFQSRPRRSIARA